MAESGKDLEGAKGRVFGLGIVTGIVVVGTLIYLSVLIGDSFETRRSSFEPLCLNNLHQLALLLKTYSDDGGGE